MWYYSDGTRCVMVEKVVSGSAAEAAGIQPGDLILKIGEKQIASGEELSSAIGEYKPGDKATLTIQRDGKESTVEVTFGLLLVSRWIKWLLGHCPVPTYYAIMGLMLASPYPIFIKSGLNFAGMGVGHLIAGCVTLVLGFALALFLDKQGEKA